MYKHYRMKRHKNLTLVYLLSLLTYLITTAMSSQVKLPLITRKLCYRKDDRAMRPMYGRPENFQESLTTPTATCPEFLMGFCSD